MNADAHSCSDSDLIYVTRCLGREPKGVVAVAARDEAGQPSVITNHPLQQEGQRWLPFPTLYWLVDAKLNSRVAEIERKGGVREIEAALQADELLLASHLEDNRRYAVSRWALLGDEDQSLCKEQGMDKVLKDSGIGGVGNHAAIKCLHAQYAYHLASGEAGTTVGKLMQKRFSL